MFSSSFYSNWRDEEDFKHFKGIEINGDYNIVITETEDNDLDKIKLMLGGDDMMEV